MFGQRRQQTCIGAGERHGVCRGLVADSVRYGFEPIFPSIGEACGRIEQRKSPPGRWSGAGELNPWQGSWGVWGTCITPWISRGSLEVRGRGDPLTSKPNFDQRSSSLFTEGNVTGCENCEVTQVTETRFPVKLLFPMDNL